jgi:hypothetical protein
MVNVAKDFPKKDSEWMDMTSSTCYDCGFPIWYFSGRGTVITRKCPKHMDSYHNPFRSYWTHQPTRITIKIGGLK